MYVVVSSLISLWLISTEKMVVVYLTRRSYKNNYAFPKSVATGRFHKVQKACKNLVSFLNTLQYLLHDLSSRVSASLLCTEHV